MVQDYPNHLQWEFLDPFIQQRVTSCEIVKAMADKPIQTTLEAAGYWSKTSTKKDNREGFLHNRYRSRRDVLIAKYGVEAAHVYLNSRFKIRELGEGLKSSTSRPPFCDIRCYVAAKAQRIKDKEEDRLEAQKQAQEQQGARQQRHRSPQPPPTTATEREVRSFVSVPAMNGRGEAVNVNVEAAESPNSRPQFVQREMPRTFIEKIRRSANNRNHLDARTGADIMSMDLSVASTEELPLGEVAGRNFWHSREEYVTHMRAIVEIVDKNKSLARYVVDHDKTTAHLKRSEKTAKVEELLVFLLDAVRSKRYEAPEQDSVRSSSTKSSTCQQLEFEIKNHLQNGYIGHHDLRRPTSEGLQRLKRVTTRQHIHLHRLQGYALGGVAESIVRGERSPIDTIKLTRSFKWVEDLGHIHTSAIAAACTDCPNVQNRLAYQYPLKLATAYEIQLRVLSKHCPRTPRSRYR